MQLQKSIFILNCVTLKNNDSVTHFMTKNQNRFSVFVPALQNSSQKFKPTEKMTKQTTEITPFCFHFNYVRK